MNGKVARVASLLLPVIAISAGVTARGQDAEYLVGQPTTAVTLPVERGFINLQNGNLHIEIPFANYQGRGSLSTSLKMVYDSMIWHGAQLPDGSYQWQPNNVNNSMGGWRFVSSLPGGISGGETTMSVCGSGSGSVTQWGPFYMTMLDGTQHTFPIITDANATPSSECPATLYPDTPSATGYAMDGSGYYAVVNNYTDMAVYDRNGSQVYYSGNGTHDQVDRNGNYNDTTHDDLGRPVAPIISTSPDGLTTYYDVLTTYGKTERYSVTTETIQLNTNFLSNSVGSDFNGSMTVVQSIGLPDGSSYSFTYEDGTYGELSGITLPQGGTINYVYESGLNGTRAGEAVPPRWVSSHTGSNGATDFSIIPANCPGGPGQIGPCPTQHNYVSRNGSTTDYSFSLKGDNGYFDDFIYYHSGDKNSSVVRTVAKTYNFDTLCPIKICQGREGYLYPNLATVAEVFNDTMLTTYTSYSYATLAVGIPTSVMQWDYYTSSASSNPPYAPSGTATRETDTALGYNVNGALFPTLVTTSDASGPLSKTTLFYDNTYDNTTHIVSSPISPSYQNDAYVTGNRGNLVAIERWLNTTNTQATTLLYYDHAGALQYSVDPLLNQTSYGYDATDTFVTSVTQPTVNTVQHNSKATYDASTGQVLKQWDQNQQLTQYAYDSLGRLSTVTAPSGAVTTTTYPSATEIDISDMQSVGVSVPSVILVDSFGRSSTTTVAGVSSGTTYDGLGRINCVITPHIANTTYSTDGSTCNTLYDMFDRVQTVLQPDGNQVTLSYADNAVTTTDEVGHTRQNTYSAFGDLSAVFEQDNQGVLDWETDYQYDGLDRLKRIDQKGGATNPSNWRTRTFDYDSLGRLTDQTTPEAGRITFNNYDLNGDLLLSTDARGVTVQYQYDALNRLTHKILQNGSTYVYSYDAQDNSGDPFGVGRLTSMQSGTNVGAYFTHDLSGNVSSEKYCLPSNCSYAQAVQATYDYHGNVNSLTYPNGFSIGYLYDLLDRPNGTFQEPIRKNLFLRGVSYYPTGELNTATYGGKLNVTATFNNRQDITSLTYSSSKLLWSKGYSWDRNAANLLSVTDKISGRVRSFAYDNVNRLTSVQDSSGSVSDTYTMDPWGNRQESGTFSFSQPFGAANQISATGYVYDSSGNQTADGLGNTYSYDADGKMSASNGAVYTRDPFGQRVRKDYSGAATEYFYFGGKLLATRDPSSNSWTNYMYAGDRIFQETGATSLYRLGDHLDSLVGKVDTSGNLLGKNDVSPYGELFSSTASDRLLFTQHERDTENGDDSALYRQYASTQGRWLSPDPYNGSYNLADPQSLNRYSYVTGRPLASVDPTGLFQLPGGDGGDGGLGGSIGDIFEAALGYLFGGGGGGPAGNPHSTVNTGFGTPYTDSNGTTTFPLSVGVSYADAATGTGAGFGIAAPAAAIAPFIFHVTAFAAALAPDNGSFQLAQYNPLNPCSNASPGGLDYSTANAQQHILQNHTQGGKGPSIYSGDWTAIKLLNGATLTQGGLAPSQSQRTGTFTLQWNAPKLPWPLSLIFTNNIGWGQTGQPTPTNRLVVKTNCSTVITSYPVTP